MNFFISPTKLGEFENYRFIVNLYFAVLELFS